MTNIAEAKVTAVIVTYNSRGHIHSALEALREAHEAGELACVVVDNVSSDGTADFIAAAHPWVELVRSERNLGFGRGCNLGFQRVRTPYVLIHNPDAVLDHQALRTLLEFMASCPAAGIVAPAIIEGESSLQEAGMMTTPGSLVRSALGIGNALPQKRPIVPGSTPFRTPWVCGAMMLIDADLFRRLQGFDPRFFLYFEETDLCRRATKVGSEIWAVGRAVAHHLGGACAKSTGQGLEATCIAEHFYRSRFYYLVKHFGWLPAVGTETLVRLLREIRHWRHRLTGRQPRPETAGKRPFLRFPAPPGDLP
ncbi:glycosyltransferase family 2 protein [Desulfurivibrio alkaliphilus]|uniref:Glycosyl transferase family 2 n=1 Tax=Desulfurivibrio alkaliphilus (strain DSM 19089 / UNIQEM U267 / AHT2) TaxID=589865 RepID=D6Z4I2_DESAT|nr:glycosyltransferase family 2 protein [Desulfurivibrio alkaliphilus]ADH86457.1 glycosyl transferase family 2 [Desulfurivibrio alkaliphilus AHT 2]